MKLWISRDSDQEIRVFTREPVPDTEVRPEEDRSRYNRWGANSASPAQGATVVGIHDVLYDILNELISPLSFSGAQIAEVELKEVARWEHPEPNDRRWPQGTKYE